MCDPNITEMGRTNKAKNECVFVLFTASLPDKNMELQVSRGCFPEVWPGLS